MRAARQALARRHRQGLRFVGIPTSEHTAAQAKAAGIPLTSFSEHRQIDLTIDGADEVERGTLNLIKGLGGALLREKIVAAASHRLAIVVDGSKLVDRLGTRTPVPVEVVAFGLEATSESLDVLGAASTAVVAVLTPICVEKFLQNSDAQANLAALREIPSNWQQGQYLEKGGWATRPGATSSDYELARACATKLIEAKAASQ